MISGEKFTKIYDLSELVDAVEDSAKRIGAKFDKKKVMRSFEVYREAFEGGCSGYRTTTKNEKTIHVRYFNLSVPNIPIEAAERAGLIPKSGHPCTGIMPYIAKNYKLEGDSSGFGVDVSTANGMEKIWVFFQETVPMGRIIEIPGLPPSIKGNLGYLERHGMARVKLVGVNYRAKSVNLYYLPWETPGYEDGKLERMITDLGFALPEADVLKHCRMSLALYHTFSWDSPGIERLCFCCVAPKQEIVPLWHPAIVDFVTNAKTQDRSRIFYYNPTFSKSDGFFTKIEICFHARYAQELLRLVPKFYLEKLKFA